MKRITFLFFFSLFLLFRNSFAQFGKIDTIVIQSIIDSCNGINAYQSKLDCQEIVLLYIKQSLKSSTDPKVKSFLLKAEIVALRNIGNTYKNLANNLPKALEFYKSSLKKAEDSKNTVGMAAALYNLGTVYEDLSENDKSLDYFQRGLKKFEEAGVLRGVGMCYNGIGNTYNTLRDFKKALEYYQKSLQLAQEIEDPVSISTSFSNIADVYYKLSDYDNAMKYYRQCLEYSKKEEDNVGVTASLLGIGDVLIKSGKQKEAEKYLNDALIMSKEIMDIKAEGRARKSLRLVYESTGRYKDALRMNDSAIAVIDSLSSIQKAEEISRMEMQSDFDIKEAETKAAHEKQLAVEEAEKKKQRIIIFSVVGGLFLVLVFTVFVLNRWRVTQRQKKIIEVQKVEVEESKKIIEQHNKDITDSIHYASRIQRALLTSDGYIGKHLKDYFILFKPKDIVSGDFYWAFSPIERVGKETFFIACCDCTGHGVPGAFMSLLNISFLNEALVEKSFRDTDKILNDVRSNVIKALNPDGKGEAKDGMDSVLCSIDLKNNILQVSCANNPVWILQNGEINEVAPDKMPVGLHSTMGSFKKNSVQLNKGDIIYTFTDGYADQFGGPKGKKFKYKQLEEVLIANHHLPMHEQKNILEKIYDDWKGNLEQVDDVLLIGIRI